MDRRRSRGRRGRQGRSLHPWRAGQRDRGAVLEGAFLMPTVERLEGGVTFVANHVATWAGDERVLRVTVSAGQYVPQDLVRELDRAINEPGAYDCVEITVNKK